ncbi:hypothetical protein EC957_011920 [Mortierella hygrophila]|uniref:Uncharacterized protein n=1 Tax=Mortierella hygrophila TaxID=979708 RepID=A0A9P6F8S3_9FUNG|nr:hypothetical protein EC957_011920 [Mortierella hygrophila]
MPTSKERNSICQPLFWNTLFLRDDERTERYTASQEGMASSGRNIDSVRSLQTRGTFLTYYTVGLVRYLRNTAPSGNGSGQFTRPNWVPCETIEGTELAAPLPPFTNLRHFRASMRLMDVSESGEVEMAMDQDAKNFDDGSLVLSTEPLTNLRYQRLPDNYRRYHADQFCPFLEQSPRLESWYVPCITESADIEAITRTIRAHCKEIKELYNGMPYANYKGELVMSVIEAMKPQWLERFSFAGYHDDLRHLMIYVHVPSAYSDSDPPQWAMFERLCLHTGSFQQLKFSDLRGATVVVDTTYNNPPQEIDYSKLTFPGLLTLGDTSTREPGYVSLLKDLKQLKTLRGSFSYLNTQTFSYPLLPPPHIPLHNKMNLNSIRNSLHVVIPVAADDAQISFSEHSEPASGDASTREDANTPQSAEAGGSHPGPPGSDNGTRAEQANVGLD